MFLNRDPIAGSFTTSYEEAIFNNITHDITLTPSGVPNIFAFNNQAKGDITYCNLIAPGIIRISQNGVYHISYTLCCKRPLYPSIGSIMTFISIDGIYLYGYGGQNSALNYSTDLSANYDVCLNLVDGDTIRCYVTNVSLTGNILLNPTDGFFDSNLVISKLV